MDVYEEANRNFKLFIIMGIISLTFAIVWHSIDEPSQSFDFYQIYVAFFILTVIFSINRKTYKQKPTI